MDVETMKSARSDGAHEPRATREPDHRDGIFGTWIALWVGMLESTVRTTGRFFQVVCGESQKAVEATIDWSEQAQQSIHRTARQANRSVFDLSAEVISRTEQAALVVLRHGQHTGDRASELAAQASQAVVGSRGLNGSSAMPVAR
jgi:hypothetical protein